MLLYNFKSFQAKGDNRFLFLNSSEGYIYIPPKDLILPGEKEIITDITNLTQGELTEYEMRIIREELMDDLRDITYSLYETIASIMNGSVIDIINKYLLNTIRCSDSRVNKYDSHLAGIRTIGGIAGIVLAIGDALRDKFEQYGISYEELMENIINFLLEKMKIPKKAIYHCECGHIKCVCDHPEEYNTTKEVVEKIKTYEETSEKHIFLEPQYPELALIKENDDPNKIFRTIDHDFLVVSLSKIIKYIRRLTGNMYEKGGRGLKDIGRITELDRNILGNNILIKIIEHTKNTIERKFADLPILKIDKGGRYILEGVDLRQLTKKQKMEYIARIIHSRRYRKKVLVLCENVMS